MNIALKRIYEPYSAHDGYRILVDRLWPRGIKKEDPRIDKWLKKIAPSTALRKWFDHDPDKWDDFRRKYHAELNKSASPDELRAALKEHKKITLLYASREEKHNHAIVLQEFIKAYLQA